LGDLPLEPLPVAEMLDLEQVTRGVQVADPAAQIDTGVVLLLSKACGGRRVAVDGREEAGDELGLVIGQPSATSGLILIRP
jgi:hypothetical protein